ncbi:chorismate synthase [Mycoplasmatota bacterium WC44]
MNSFGTNIRVSIFGESHGPLIGITIDGLPAGMKLDLDFINSELDKRRSKSNLTTPRQEKDTFEIVSGFLNEYTTGTPLTFLIKNNDVKSNDYDMYKLRPSHADYTAFSKYGGFQDYRGGGHFSGRLTALIVIIGAISRSILLKKGIKVHSHILRLKDILDDKYSFDNISDKVVINKEVKEEMDKLVLETKEKSDSVGGVVETIVLGVEAGYGEPFFDSIESIISHLIFSIPGVKGVEFGAGFDISEMYGSEANDEFDFTDKLITKTNNSGGINGGISNGMPILIRSAFRPTPTIGKIQKSVNYKTKETIEIEGKGRHDPAIILRGYTVVNSIVAFGILELISRSEGTKWML